MSITLSVNTDKKQRPGVSCAAILSDKNVRCLSRDEKTANWNALLCVNLPNLMIYAKYSGKRGDFCCSEMLFFNEMQY